MVAQRSQVTGCVEIVEMVKYGLETWFQDQWIKYLANTADGFSGLLAFAVTAKDVQCTGKPIPGSPVVGKVDNRSLQSGGCLLRAVVILKVPAATKLPIAGIAS